MVSKREIDFFIIGTQKAGTTSLYNYLIQHPDIYFSEVKELRYFIDPEIYARGEKYLDDFFYKYNGQKLRGTSHVHMLPCKEAPERVFNYNPNAKIIVILREPVSRAKSAFDYAIKNGWELKARSLYEAYTMEKERLNESPVNFDLLYFNNGLYAAHLNNWNKFFPAEQVLIVKDSELRNQSQLVLNKIYNFLGIKLVTNDFSKQYNTKSYSRFPLLRKFISSRSKYKKQFGKLLNNKTKVWVRSYLFTKLIQMNTVEITNEKQIPEISDNEHLNEYKRFFERDLEELFKKYSTDFN